MTPKQQGSAVVIMAVALGLAWWFWVREPAPNGVALELNGSGKAAITVTVNGALEQQTVDLPWKGSKDAKPGSVVAFAGQLQGSGQLECVLRAGRQELQRAASSGSNVMVTCAASVP